MRVTALIDRLCLQEEGPSPGRVRSLQKCIRLAEVPKAMRGRTDIACSVENILNFTIFL